MKEQLALALTCVWSLLGLASLAVVGLPLLVPEALWVGRTPACTGCFLCGATRAFAAIARGDLASATEIHALAVPLYALLWANGLAALALAVRRCLVPAAGSVCELAW